VTFRDEADSIYQATLYRADTAWRSAYAKAACTVSIEPFTEAIVLVQVPQYCNGKTVLLEQVTNASVPRFATARSLSKCLNGKTYCHIFNYQPKTMNLLKVISWQKLRIWLMFVVVHRSLKRNRVCKRRLKQ